MEIKFTKQGNVWVSEFEATGDFNLHLEGVDTRSIKISQSGTPEGKYDTVRDIDTYGFDKVFDFDFSALVYPKWIKVECATQPTKASVISNGEISPSGGGAEVKNGDIIY